jgi:hypothetical protein
MSATIVDTPIERFRCVVPFDQWIIAGGAGGSRCRCFDFNRYPALGRLLRRGERRRTVSARLITTCR